MPCGVAVCQVTWLSVRYMWPCLALKIRVFPWRCRKDKVIAILWHILPECSFYVAIGQDFHLLWRSHSGTIKSSPETDCSVDMVDLVYAEGSGETECLVDIVSGLVDTHSHVHVSGMRMRAHIHTHWWLQTSLLDVQRCGHQDYCTSTIMPTQHILTLAQWTKQSIVHLSM